MGCDAFLYNITEKNYMYLGRWYHFSDEIQKREMAYDPEDLIGVKLNKKQVLKIVKKYNKLYKTIKSQSNDISEFVLIHDYMADLKYTGFSRLFEDYKEVEIE